MTDKEIIINGIDVTECTYRRQNPHNFCMCASVINESGNIIELTRYVQCEYNPNCYFKQLKRKDLECEELKEKIKKYSNINEQDTKDFAILHNSFIEIEGLVKNFCEDCSEYERCDYEKDGCYYSIVPRLKDIIKKVKEGE